MTGEARDKAARETISVLLEVMGGRELLDWFGGVPDFGDGEVMALILDRAAQSKLSLRLDRRGTSAIVTFVLHGWIDVAVRGFSRQNVIGGLKLSHAGERQGQVWEIGVGCVPGKIEIELEPCFGAYGTIRANLSSIEIKPLPTREQDVDNPARDDAAALIGRRTCD